MLLTPMLHLWKSWDIWTPQKYLLHISHPAPTARALGRPHSGTEQSKNLCIIVSLIRDEDDMDEKEC